MASAQDTAASLGYSVSFFQQSPELKSLLDQATSGNWTADRFVAAFRNTQWFRQNSEAQRKYNALATGDPATLREQLDQATGRVMSLAQQMGLLMTPTEAGGAADYVVRYGWNDDQIKQSLASRLMPDENGAYRGQAGSLERQFKQLVADYGIDVSDQVMGSWIRQGIVGSVDANAVKQQLINQATAKYPPFAERLKAGETMRQIADPYIQSQSKLLELNPESVGINDPLIQQALVSKDAKGQPVAKAVWEFENDLRRDPRWAKTQNAQDAMSNTASKILTTFGLQ